jgi:small subunit ribosomal protein S6
MPGCPQPLRGGVRPRAISPGTSLAGTLARLLAGIRARRPANDRIALLSRNVRGRFESEGGGERMRQYELMVILDPDVEERTVAPSLDQFLNVIRKDGGTVDKVDIWGRRRLAHEIDKKSDGIYAVIDMQAQPDSVKELDRQLNLTETVLRTKVVRKDGK